MNFNWKEHKYLKAILKKMCYWVNADFYSLDFFNHDDPFYRKYSWTKDAQENFTKWMTDFLCENSEARKELMNWSRRVKRNCRKAAEEFVGNYGWVLKD